MWRTEGDRESDGEGEAGGDFAFGGDGGVRPSIERPAYYCRVNVEGRRICCRRGGEWGGEVFVCVEQQRVWECQPSAVQRGGSGG